MMILKGSVIAGFGEGAYFTNKDAYKKEFKKILGYEPWPGTLNLKVGSKISLAGLKPIIIKGFREDETTFGNLDCYKCSIVGNKDIVLHLVVPKINKHENNIIELISQNNLRKTLSLKDKDIISIELM
jgi:riboflavin kinase